MVVLFFGDVVGSSGCQALRRNIASLKRQYNARLVIANGENSADGNGITPQSAEDLFQSSVDVITTGNHVFRRKEVYPYLEEQEFLLRPVNYPDKAPGRGWCAVDLGYASLCVVSLMGVAYMDSLQCPFAAMDALLPTLPGKNIIVDFHGEATGEKGAMAYYLDGRVTALIGTHTHVQTADETILPGGTAFLSDAGMCGPSRSVLGVRPELVISRLKDKLPVRFENAEGPAKINGVALDIDEKTGKANRITRIQA